MQNFKTTADIKVPDKLIDQVIGQKAATEIVKKASRQRRNILLIGDPGTGKTMLAQAMAELLPATELEDILVYKNPNDENMPLIKDVKTYPNEEARLKKGDGQGRQILQKERMKNRMGMNKSASMVTPIILMLVIVLFGLSLSGLITGYEIIVLAALMLGILIFGSMIIFMTSVTRRGGGFPGMGITDEPKLIVDNTGYAHAPFIDATGSRAGALFGDVRHDPLQCIPAGEKVLRHDGNVIKIEQFADPFFAMQGKTEGEIDVSYYKPRVMGGFDADFKLAPTDIMKIYKRRYMGELVKVHTRSGSEIKVTPNHPIATLNSDGKIKYIEAGLIDKSIKIVIPERLHRREGRYLDDDELNIIADVLADGWIGARRVEFSLKQEFKIERILADFKKAGYKPRVSIRSDGATRISINSSILCKTLRSMRAIEGKEKRVPALIFLQHEYRITMFLSRLLSLDGYVNPQGQFEIMSSSKQFIQQLRSLLFIIGVNGKYKTRLDPGYGKEKHKIQHMIRWNSLEFAKSYRENTINPIHVRNADAYLKTTTYGKECFDDVIPLNYALLDGVRQELGASKESVHQDFWSFNQSLNNPANLTRNMLQNVTNRLEEIGAGSDTLDNIKKLSQGDYAFDEITEIERVQYDGYVYNLTTESGNYLVDFVLTHNTGGLGTPAHLRVESGAVHKANKGVLFIDEVSRLEPKSQQDLLTSLQEKKYPITGQSEMSSGALVKTEPVPADFILVAAGNLQDIQNMHPALRSRIRGYGYEVYMESTMEDNETNRAALLQFIAQEIRKDGKIPHFDKGAVEELFEEARRRAGRKKRLTLILRDLGGLIRAAGDIAIENNKKVVTKEDVIAAHRLANSIEAQVVNQEIEYRKDYKVFGTRGFSIGKVNGLAVIGSSTITSAGIVLPIVAEVTPASSRSEGKFIPTGKLGKIANEAVKNVSAIIKKHMGRDVANYDMHVQFLQSYTGVEGDSASISVAISIISAMENLPVDQSMAMTGSLSVRGQVLPVGGITSKVEAAINAGMRAVIIPASNIDDVYLSKPMLKRIKIIPVRTLGDVIKYSIKQSKRKNEIIKELHKHESAMGDSK